MLRRLSLIALHSFTYASVCAATLVAITSLGAESEEQSPKRSEALHLNGDDATWRARRYLKDDRPFLVKFKEVAAEIEVFPFQWLIYTRAVSANLVENSYVNHEDAQRFYHFADLARTATKRDLQDCVDHLAEASPTERALLLVVLHFSLDDAYLPQIAEYIDDYSMPFPHFSSKDAETWRRQRAVEYARERNVRDFARLTFPGFGNTLEQWETGSFAMKYVSDYALAILKLRGCRLVSSMREMWRYQWTNWPQPENHEGNGAFYRPGIEKHREAMEAPFSQDSWEKFRSMSLDVRRLRHEYILQVECVSPPYRDAAMAAFVKKLEKAAPRTAALACFCVDPRIAYDRYRDELSIPDWPDYVRKIPSVQIIELLTSEELGTIDADLTFRPQSARFLGYPPYFQTFLIYVLRHNRNWFTEQGLCEIEPRMSGPAREAWQKVKFVGGRKADR